MKSRTLVLSSFCLLALTWMGGCGSGYDGPRLHPLTGRISINGQPPGDSFKVALASDDPARPSPDLLVNADGTYQALTGFAGKGLPGAAAGKYKVVLQALRGGAGAYQPGGQGPTPGVPQLPQDLAAFGSAETSTKEIEVVAGKNEIDITIP
ncbi:MAG: hypothetical protein J5I93_19770 [Pirellulaceae bacterium]|nr:hypothetical protein [Pirellulaceae bacterium]